MIGPGQADNRLEFERRLNKAFSPHAPINDASFFSGRIPQIRAVADAIRRPGLHIAIYGERGVGKTSLANILGDFFAGDIGVSRVNCAQIDTFESVIRRGLEAIQVTMPTSRVGFGDREELVHRRLTDLVPADHPSPDRVGSGLSRLPIPIIFVIDEFDRLPPQETTAFSDLIKSLSDRAAQAKVVLVGVAESVDKLIESHASVERCLLQVRLPRMSEEELGEIVDRGLTAVGLVLSSDAPRRRILTVSQGFPHYTHVLTLNAARSALDASRTTITEQDVIEGMAGAVEDADQSHRDAYHTATAGVQASLWREVVAACALAESDERGYFSLAAVQDTLGRILGRPVVQQTVSYHIGKLIEEGRGPLLQRSGPRGRYRYRFLNPLMRPFILMKSLNELLISPRF